MSSGAPVPIPPSDSRAYKRSWRNLLINKQVQLRFTMFMVGLSALLMVLLGVWVKRVADNTTEVGLNRVRGEICPPLPPALEGAPSPAAAAAVPADDEHPSVPKELGEPAPMTAGATDGPTEGPIDGPTEGPIDAPSEGATGSPASDGPSQPADAGAGGAAPERARSRVQLDESSMTITPAGPQELQARVRAHQECEARQKALISDLTSRRRNIVWVLFASGIFLCAGLAIFGIKMTHRVAGPLHKITQYFGKMQHGRYGQVYPLRKGDELVELYEHFKAAHDGVRRAEAADLARIRAVLAAAKGRTHDPELASKLQALAEAADRKERSLEQGEGA